MAILIPGCYFPPDFFDTVKKDELRCVFYHELGHLKCHDIAVSWLVAVLQIIHWFNPFVWYAFHRMRVDQEMACDAFVLSRINRVKPADYANTIVDLLERFIQNRQLPSLAGIIENKSQIRRRITMIMNFKKYTYKMTSISILILFVVGFVFFTSSSGFSGENDDGEVYVTPFNLSESDYDDVYNIDEVDSKPQIVQYVQPLYPFTAKEQQLNGKVVIRFIIDTEGQVCEPEVINPTFAIRGEKP